jgi:hypothetical protein
VDYDVSAGYTTARVQQCQKPRKSQNFKKVLEDDVAFEWIGSYSLLRFGGIILISSTISLSLIQRGISNGKD